MSEINVISKTQRIIVDAPTRSASVILAGPVGPQAPSFLAIPWFATASGNALTNSPITERFVLNLPTTMIKLVPLNGQTQARMVCNVTTPSASVNTPRVRCLFKEGVYNTSLGNYTELGVTEVGVSLDSSGYKDTGWVDLHPAASGDIFVGLTERGGDGVLDPSLGHLMLYFR